MTRFKEGDRVVCVDKFDVVSAKMKGVVVLIDGGFPPIGVKWDKLDNGHSLLETLSGDDIRKGYFMEESYIALDELNWKERIKGQSY